MLYPFNENKNSWKRHVRKLLGEKNKQSMISV